MFTSKLSIVVPIFDMYLGLKRNTIPPRRKRQIEKLTLQSYLALSKSSLRFKEKLMRKYRTKLIWL